MTNVDPSARHNLGVISWHPIWPRNTAGAVRSNQLYPRLTRWHVRLACPGEPSPEIDTITLPRHWLTRLPLPWSPQVFSLWGKAPRLLATHWRDTPPDVVIGDGIWAADAARYVARHFQVPFLLTVYSIEHLSRAGAGRNPLLYTVTRHLERRAYHQADALLVLTENDRTTLQQLGLHDRPIFVVPGGADLDTLSATGPDLRSQWRIAPDEHVLLFHGKLNYPPNRDALQWLASEIAPRIRKKIPRTRFICTGTGAPTEPLPPLEFPGFVDQLADALRSADVCIAPVRDGSGMRFKILESLAARKPLVTTTLGDSGVGTEDGVHLLRRDTAESFGEAVCQLLDDPATAAALAAHGQAFIRQHYDWGVVAGQLEHVLEQLISTQSN